MFEAPATPPPAPIGIAEANIPADGGLSGLGLLMSLTGAIFFIMAMGMGTLLMFTLLMAGGSMGGAGTELLLILAAITASVVRSWAHRAAGQRLLYDGPGTPRSAMTRYFVLAGVQTALVAGALAIEKTPGTLIWPLVVMLAGWPVVLAVILAGARFKALLDQPSIPQGNDRGFEGAAILMVVFGLTGLLFGAVMAIGSFEQLGSVLKVEPFAGFSLLTIVGLLIGRSALHLRAGIRGMREVHLENATSLAARYGSFAVLAAAISCGLMFLMMLVETGGRMEGAGVFLVLTMMVFLFWGLTAWPLIIKRFFIERQFADLLANGGSPHTRAPDRGFTTLGWLLFGQAVMALTMMLPALWAGPRNLDDYDPMSQIFSAFQAGGAATWWSIGAAVLQLVAAWQLIHMRPNHKQLVTVWGVAATLIAVYVNYPMLTAMSKGGLHGAFRGSEAMLSSFAFTMVAIALVAPVASLILVHRKQRELPTAVLQH